MPQPPPRPHGTGIRGLTLSRGSLLFQGPFGRIFRALPPADFGATDEQSKSALATLAAAMHADADPPKDGPDSEESGIPAAYTYLGQFIDHDLTFDPASSLQRQNDPDALVDYRTPRFDLDSVYGRGPDDQPYLYVDGRRLLTGRKLTGNALGKALTAANDLPRSVGPSVDPQARARAIIGDPRNDENVIVSQLQGLFLRFHNNVAKALPTLSFAEVQREVRFHYQWMVLTDFLPAVVSDAVLKEVLPHRARGSSARLDPPKLEFYSPKDEPFIPLEFSVAAYRFGHSMVRPAYRLNDAIAPLPIFVKDDLDPSSLGGFREFPSAWAIDWGRFVNLEPRPFGDENDPTNPGNAKRMQLAYRIDTSLVNPLAGLPARVAADPPPSLAERNLRRAWRMRLPNGQNVARAMGVTPLTDDAIKIGKFTGAAGDIKGNIVDNKVGGAVFANNCPLWTYVLAETEVVDTVVKTTEGDKRIKTRRLGPVGGRIVAETIVGLLVHDSSSYLNQDPLWRPRLALDGNFGLREFVLQALAAEIRLPPPGRGGR